MTSTNEAVFLLSDRPVGLDDDHLWGASKTRRHIERICARLAASLEVDAPATHQASMTFAVHGKWGMGKSSALRMIRERTLQLARDKGWDSRLHFCSYVATAHEGLSYDVRTSMAVRMLGALAGGTLAAVEHYLPEVIAMDGGPERALPRGAPSDRAAVASQTLTRVAGTLSQLIDFDRILAEQLEGTSQRSSRVLVVFVDDLDRCRPEFVWRVLDTIQQFSDVPHLYFILGVDADHLHDSVRERFAQGGHDSSPEFALEKYVQDSLRLPDLLAEDRQKYVLSLTHQQEYGALRETLQRGMRLLDVGLRVHTPRSIKRFLNRLGGEVERLNGQSTPDERLLVLKEQLLILTWPQFYEAYFLRASVDRRRANEFRVLQSHARLHIQDLPLLRFILQQNAEIYPDAESFTPELLRFLGTDPIWFEERPKADAPARATPIISTAESEKLTMELTALYIQLKANIENEEHDKLPALFERAVDLATEKQAFLRAGDARWLGNIAIYAEKIDPNRAQWLYEASCVLWPELVNNANNYIDFIVTGRHEALYPRARELVQRLRDRGVRDDQANRTAILDVQLTQAAGGDAVAAVESAASAIEDVLRRFHAKPRIDTFTTAITMLENIRDFKRPREVARVYHKHTSTPEEAYTVVRGLADVLGGSDAPADELEAMELYRFILSHIDHYGSSGIRYLSACQHNYATLLHRHNYTREAARQWQMSYEGDASDRKVRRQFAIWLAENGHGEAADQVFNGNAVDWARDYPDLFARRDELPECFIDPAIERWWEAAADAAEPAAVAT